MKAISQRSPSSPPSPTGSALGAHPPSVPRGRELRRELVPGSVHLGSFSQMGASGEPGAIQMNLFQRAAKRLSLNLFQLNDESAAKRTKQFAVLNNKMIEVEYLKEDGKF